MKLDLETLKQVKFTFDIHSDHSTICNGYRSLCKMIEEAEKVVLQQANVIKSVCDICDSTTEMPMYKLCHKHYAEYEKFKQTVL